MTNMNVMMILLCNLVLTDPQAEWSTELGGLSQASWRVSSLVVTEKEHVYFLDGEAHLIFHLDERGREVGVFGRKGQGPGEFVMAWKMAFIPQEEKLLLLDSGQWKLIQFDLAGRFLREDKIDFRLLTGQPVFVSSERAVLIESENPFHGEPNQGARFLLLNWSDSSEMVLMNNDASRHGDSLTGKDKRGRLSLIHLPWTPSSLLTISPDRRFVFMGSTKDVDFSVYEFGAKEMVGQIVDNAFPVSPLTEEDLACYEEIFKNLQKPLKAYSPPDVKPPVGWVLCDTANRLWVLRRHRCQPSNVEWFVYDRQGKKQGQLYLPRSYGVQHASPTHLWCVVCTDDQEETWIKKMVYSLE